METICCDDELLWRRVVVETSCGGDELWLLINRAGIERVVVIRFSCELVSESLTESHALN